jgi:hypothetical protein
MELIVFQSAFYPLVQGKDSSFLIRRRKAPRAFEKEIAMTKSTDEKALTDIVKEMATSMTAEQSTRHWADDALWFDIPAFASRGLEPAKVLQPCNGPYPIPWPTAVAKRYASVAIRTTRTR